MELELWNSSSVNDVVVMVILLFDMASLMDINYLMFTIIMEEQPDDNWGSPILG